MGWLYTNTKYLPKGLNGTWEIHKNIMIIQNMREREKAFYKAMGVNDIHELIAQFKALKDYDFEDLKLLRNCTEKVGASGMNLDTIINNLTWSSSNKFNANIPITITFNFADAKQGTEQIRGLLAEALNSIQVSGEFLSIDGECAPGSKLTLKLLPDWKHFQNLKMTGLKTKADLEKMFQQVLQEGALTISSQGDTPTSQTRLLNMFFTQANFPWDLTSTVYEEMKAMGIDVDAELRRANTTIRDAFISSMNSPNGRVAQLFKEYFDATIKSDASFFQKGANYRKGIRGAIGEIAGSVIAHMLYEAGGTNKENSFMAQVFGSHRMEGGYEHPIDVLINLGGEIFGIQSKNFAEQNQHRTYNTALLGSSLTMNDGENQSIINASFNLNAPYANSFGQLAQYVAANYGQQLLRLSFENTSMANIDKPGVGNQFFLIGGQYLVPGSVLLEYNLTSYRGSGPTATMGDKDFNPTVGVGGDERPDPEFVKYWTSPEPFTPTSYNATQYAAIGHRISFQFDFQMTMTNLQEYSLF